MEVRLVLKLGHRAQPTANTLGINEIHRREPCWAAFLTWLYGALPGLGDVS